MSETKHEKIHIDLPNHWATGGESMWAEPLGDNLFKIKNAPFFAYGLNYDDVVRATADSESLKPEIRALVESSGHRTFRLFFNKELTREQQEDILDSFQVLHVSYERANDTYVVLDLTPEGSYSSVFDKLDGYEKQELLSFETCEQKIFGSFDDLPNDNS